MPLPGPSGGNQGQRRRSRLLLKLDWPGALVSVAVGCHWVAIPGAAAVLNFGYHSGSGGGPQPCAAISVLVTPISPSVPCWCAVSEACLPQGEGEEQGESQRESLGLTWEGGVAIREGAACTSSTAAYGLGEVGENLWGPH